MEDWNDEDADAAWRACENDRERDEWCELYEASMPWRAMPADVRPLTWDEEEARTGGRRGRA